MNFLDTKFINLISPNLKNFKKKSNNLYNFSCPICGDSKKSQYKARGYFFENDNGSCNFKCHNCNSVFSFPFFLKNYFPEYYSEYNFEKFYNKNDNGIFKNKLVKNEPAPTIDVWKNLLTPLESNQSAFDYIKNRKIPEIFWKDIYFCEDINSLKSIFGEKYNNVNLLKEDRIVLPIFNFNKQLVGFSTRSISKHSKLRYVKLRIDSDDLFIWGVDKLNLGLQKFITEGAFDAMFLPNSMAVNGADLEKAFNFIGVNDIFIFDNQPYNRQLIQQMLKLLEKNFNIFIWPKSIKHKDINDLVLSGFKYDLVDFIKENTYNGLKLKLKLNEWSQT